MKRRTSLLLVVSAILSILIGCGVRVVAGGGLVSTLSFITDSLSRPRGLVLSGGSLFVTDDGNGWNRILRVDLSSDAITVLAGDNTVPGERLDGVGEGARFNDPRGIVVHGDNVYVVEGGSGLIRTVSVLTGVVETPALSGALVPYYGPEGLAVSPDGATLYVADYGNGVVQKINVATWQSAALTASGELWNPVGVTISSDGSTLYVTDEGKQMVLSVDASSGAVAAVAGSEGVAGHDDGTGASATFNIPKYMTTDGTFIYLTDDSNNLVRKIEIATKRVTTVAGSAEQTGSDDGSGAAARFNYPKGIALTADGTTLYVADGDNGRIRKITGF